MSHCQFGGQAPDGSRNGCPVTAIMSFDRHRVVSQAAIYRELKKAQEAAA